MYTLFRTIGTSAAVKHELLPFGIAFVIAELFYKFHSFTLECLAFLATWFALSVVMSLFVKPAGHPAAQKE
jgi:hypothetical protein